MATINQLCFCHKHNNGNNPTVGECGTDSVRNIATTIRCENNVKKDKFTNN